MKRGNRRNRKRPVVGGMVGQSQHQRRKRRGPTPPMPDLESLLTEGIASLEKEKAGASS